MNNHSAHYNQK